MDIPTIPHQIVFRSFRRSDAVLKRVLKELVQLEIFFPRIVDSRVVLELSARRRHQGNLFRVRIFLKVPGEEIIVGRDPVLDHSHEDLYVAIRDAFDAAQRQLEDYVRRRRIRVHLRERRTAPRGQVVRLLYDDGGYGFLATEDGRELYFHRHSVLNGRFDDLKVGTRVRFQEEEGVEGPQASTVKMGGGRRGSRVRLAS